MAHDSGLGVSELIAAAAVVFLLIAVQGMFIAKHPTTLNAAAALAEPLARLVRAMLDNNPPMSAVLQ
jgi:hypothetical protein